MGQKLWRKSVTVLLSFSTSNSYRQVQTSKTKALGWQNWAVKELRTRALILLFEKNKLKYLLYVWKPFEHEKFSFNMLFCVLKCFFISSDTCKIKCLLYIKSIGRSLFIENVSCCDWLTQNLLINCGHIISSIYSSTTTYLTPHNKICRGPCRGRILWRKKLTLIILKVVIASLHWQWI